MYVWHITKDVIHIAVSHLAGKLRTKAKNSKFGRVNTSGRNIHPGHRCYNRSRLHCPTVCQDQAIPQVRAPKRSFAEERPSHRLDDASVSWSRAHAPSKEPGIWCNFTFRPIGGQTSVCFLSVVSEPQPRRSDVGWWCCGIFQSCSAGHADRWETGGWGRV